MLQGALRPGSGGGTVRRESSLHPQWEKTLALEGGLWVTTAVSPPAVLGVGKGVRDAGCPQSSRGSLLRCENRLATFLTDLGFVLYQLLLLKPYRQEPTFHPLSLIL